MIDQDDLTSKQNDYAIFLPAVSSFYATYIGKQRFGNFTDTTRMPAGISDMEMMNWLNPQKALFPYQWSLYSAGHANLDLTKHAPKEDMIRNRDPGSTVLGDSGGFQIAKGVWEGDWKAGSGCPKAQKHRETALKWLDGIADYAMVLDIPSFVIHEKNGHKSGIRTLEEAADATKYNNEYFMANRRGVKNGGTRFLNVLQGGNHRHADEWYEMMKGYCDPAKYPDTHFNGWAMGGQNMCDVHLILRRLVALRYDGLLQEGVHDWMHFLGTSRLEWAVLLTAIQRAVRRHVNPSFTISFDCASPFLATANGQVYNEIYLPHNDKWSYRMSFIVDDKKYATDNRSYRDAILQDGLIDVFEDSPISSRLKVSDVCVYKPGDLNKIGKEGKTSWDSFSYALLMGHNVWMHIESVQRANRLYDSGQSWPNMMWYEGGDHVRFHDLVEDIFAAPDRATAEALIEKYDRYWMEIIGGRGFVGKKAKNATTMFNALFDVEHDPVEHGHDIDEVSLEESRLDQLENEVDQ